MFAPMINANPKNNHNKQAFTVELLKMQDIEGYVLAIESMRVYETNKQTFLKTLKGVQKALLELINQLEAQE